MISFRFHVVSITAIFLAIAVGVVVGSTYIDRLTVDQLESRIETVEDRADQTRAENERLDSELQRAREYIDQSAAFAVTDRLLDVPAVVVAARGVDEEAVEDLVVLARTAGGQVPGVLWVEPRWSADGEEDLDTLSAIVDGDANDDRGDLWRAAWSTVAEELMASEEPVVAGPPEEPAEAPVLDGLEEAGFLSLDPLGDDTVGLTDLAGTGARILVVSGAQADADVAPVVPVAVSASVDAGLVTAVADVYVTEEDGPGRGASLVDTYDEDVRELLVLVDHADLQEGRVASVLALDAAADGEVGVHYGYGEGADAVLPAWSAP
jgi:hypothetical protein